MVAGRLRRGCAVSVCLLLVRRLHRLTVRLAECHADQGGDGGIAVGERAVATDVSLEALRVAQWNADALGARVDLICCDLAGGVGGCFDLIVSNPPYIPGREIATLQRGWGRRISSCGALRLRKC
ncbi:MAG: methyltransferase [Acidobacteria bacterium]|nr:methyltransferase [Acidobacteriota bacterium]